MGKKYLNFKYYPYKTPIGIENENIPDITIINGRSIKTDPKIVKEALKNAVIKPITYSAEVTEITNFFNLNDEIIKHINDHLNKYMTVEKLILSIRYAYTKINIYNNDEKVLEFRITNNNDDIFEFSECVPNFILVSIVKGIRIIHDSEIIIYI